MKRIRVSLSAGCYSEPNPYNPVGEIPILFDDRDFYCTIYDKDLEKMPVVGRLWYLDLHRVPSLVYCDEERREADLDFIQDAEVRFDENAEERPCEDKYVPNLRGVKKMGGVDYEMEWKERYQGIIVDELCDRKLAGCFCWEHDPESNEIVGCKFVVKRGDYKKNSIFINVRVVEE